MRCVKGKLKCVYPPRRTRQAARDRTISMYSQSPLQYRTGMWLIASFFHESSHKTAELAPPCTPKSESDIESLLGRMRWLEWLVGQMVNDDTRFLGNTWSTFAHQASGQSGSSNASQCLPSVFNDSLPNSLNDCSSVTRESTADWSGYTQLTLPIASQSWNGADFLSPSQWTFSNSDYPATDDASVQILNRAVY